MNKILFFILIMLLSLLTASCSSITKEEAIKTTRGFINEKVKFYINENSSSPVVQQASITILNTEKKNGNWNIYLNIKSNETGALKQSNVVVVVDSKKGNVVSMDKI